MTVMTRDLLDVIASITDTETLEKLFEEIFTPRELEDLSLRWKLLQDLHQGMTQRAIAKKYRISLCKITRGSKILKKEGSITLGILKAQKSRLQKGENGAGHD